MDLDKEQYNKLTNGLYQLADLYFVWIYTIKRLYPGPQNIGYLRADNTDK